MCLQSQYQAAATELKHFFQVDRRHYGDRGGADPGGLWIQVSHSLHTSPRLSSLTVYNCRRRKKKCTIALCGNRQLEGELIELE